MNSPPAPEDPPPLRRSVAAADLRTCKRCARVLVITKFRTFHRARAGRPPHRAHECNDCHRKSCADARSARARGGRPTELCEICKIRPPVHCDHDHLTGAFRGWLCRMCNTGLGAFGDDIAGLERALEYLKRTRS